MYKWLLQLFCKHKHTIQRAVNKGHYDYEEWYVCKRCGKVIH